MRRPLYARPRIALSIACGAFVFVSGPLLVPAMGQEPELHWLSTWATFCAAFLLSVLVSLRGLDAEGTRRLAEREDDGRNLSRALLFTGSLVSLFAVGSGILRGHQLDRQRNSMETVVVLATLVTVALTWLLVHTDAMLHYARLYYEGDDGGIDFGPEPPSYTDFAYLAFSVGMTFQVSDTTVSDRRIRRAVLHHSLLSYLFGTILVALTINGVASLAG